MTREHLITNHPNLGVMCPMFSLPSSYGIGDFGSSKEFLKKLSKSNFKTWQILPLNITGYMDSPYQAVSSYGGDEMYLDLEELKDFYNLDLSLSKLPFSKYIDYSLVKKFKRDFIYQVFNLVKDDLHDVRGYQNFLRAYPLIIKTCEFLVLKEYHSNVSWDKFTEEFSLENDKMRELYHYHLFSQYTFMRQWLQIRGLADRVGITIMGDLPFYVGYDSADVFYNREMFYLDGTKLISKAGVPADYYSCSGQLWGNPIYRWDTLAHDNYNFWLDRIKYQRNLYDVIRLDHFRAFDTYWAIAGDSDSALSGKWLPGPSYNFFDALFKEMPDINIIVEDLGLLTEGVQRLRDHYNLLGMSVLQFMIDWDSEDLFRIHNPNTILFSGTHDNHTLLGYYMDLSPEHKNQIYKYFLDQNKDEDVMTNLLNLCLGSNAAQVIIPLFDLLFKSDEARINIPSTIGGNNWKYRIENYEEVDELLEIFKKG
ncbi:MAG: 4-alpha-glucanotransferase [Anaerorhabdus sp.]